MRTLTAALAARVFQELGVTVSICSSGVWRTINMAPSSVVEIEVERGSQLSRWRYNARSMGRAWKDRSPVLGEHAGFYDLFVPIDGGAPGKPVLVAGPFALERPTSAEVTRRWYDMARVRAHLADPAFARYLSSTLATLTLEGSLFRVFERLLSCLARALGDHRDPDRLASEWEALEQKVLKARSTERMWETARSMTDDRTAHVWSTPHKRDPLAALGMARPPQHAVVGLLRGRPDEPDPIGEALRRRAFQVAVTTFAEQRGNAACGTIGDHGVVLLTASTGERSRVRPALLDLAARAAEFARRFGFRLHAGVARSAHAQSLAARYRAALSAADRALSLGVSVALAEDRPERSARRLAELRARLADDAEGRPNVLLARFEQYAEAAAAHAGYQLDATRAHLEAGLDRLSEPLLASGQLDPRSLDELSAATAAAPDAAPTVKALVAAYRGVVTDIERALESPIAARQNRSTRRALRFMREHLSEPLTLAQVARVAGFAPNYFSRLLKREEGVTFERYLQTLRLEHAKYALRSTSLTVERVAQVSGFKSRTSFQRLFREHTGATPIAYRRRGGRRDRTRFPKSPRLR
jgi:AraC-like DNA-binding protein